MEVEIRTVANLLGRQLTEPERLVRSAMADGPTHRIRHSAEHSLASRPGMEHEVYAAALSLIEVPIRTPWQRRLCAQLIGLPEFLTYLIQPANFSEEDLFRICKVLMEIDQMVDVKLAQAVRQLSDAQGGGQKEAVLRLLGVLDRISPGRRVVMSLFPLLRGDCTATKSKAALLLGKRVQNPGWMDRQFDTPDERMRANLIESLWGTDTPNTRLWLKSALMDAHNRVVGNALVGLFLLKDPSVPRRVREMLGHAKPRFRATAAWVIGKMAAAEFREDLKAAMLDREDYVRSAAARALELLPTEQVEPQVGAVPQPVEAEVKAIETAVKAVETAPEPAVKEIVPEESVAEEAQEDEGSFGARRFLVPSAPRHRG